MLIKRALIILCLFMLTACGAGTSPLVEDVDRLTRATQEGDFTELVTEAQAHWENRSDADELQLAIETWERAVQVPTPEGEDRRALLAPIYAQLSQAYYWYADYHLGGYRVALDSSDGPEHEDELQRTHRRGMEHGQTSLALSNNDWTRALQTDREISDAASLLREDDAMAAYWYAVNASRWALLEGLPEILRRNDDIRAIMERIGHLDEDLYYGAYNRYFGAYYTRLPFGNPNLDGSRENFLRAIERHPTYLDSRYLYAADWARTTNDREVAEQQLEYILNFDLDEAPQLRPENEATQAKARQMMESLDRYFR